MKRKQQLIHVTMLMFISMLTGLLLPACGRQAQRPFTIGIVYSHSLFVPFIEGFKSGMAELGYVEGKDVTYLYRDPIGVDSLAIENEIQYLLDRQVDMLLVTAEPTVEVAQKMVAGTDMPVIFGLVADPVGDGYVESISHPGGNFTGVQDHPGGPKVLELLSQIAQDLKKVYVPYNPGDQLSIKHLPRIEAAAAKLKIELVHGEVRSVNEAVTAIESLPEDVGAIILIPAPTLDTHSSELSRAAIKRGLPTGTAIDLDDTILLTLSLDMVEQGEQVARLAHEVRQGIKPADLPIETAELYLTLNLKTAEAIGIEIPYDILRQADTIIR